MSSLKSENTGETDCTRLDEQLAKIRGSYANLLPPQRERVHKGLDSLIAISDPSASNVDETELQKSREGLLHWGNARYNKFPDPVSSFENYTARRNTDDTTRDTVRAYLDLEKQGIFLRDMKSPGQSYILAHPEIERAALNSLTAGFIYSPPAPSSDERFHVRITKPAIFGIVDDKKVITKKGEAEVRPASHNPEGWKWGCK